jgi:geranylgeranyl reductase family protein
MADFDVIVVGAGPGGATTAMYLARAGIRTLLVDKGTFPRDKACGDLLPRPCIDVVEDLGLRERLDALPHGSPRTLVLRTETEQIRLEHVSYVTVARLSFDDMLFRAAQERVETLEGARVQRVVALAGEGSRVEMITDAGARIDKVARLVVGADGYGSVVARRGQRRRGGERLALAVRGYWRNVPIADHEVHFYYLRECSPGYVWVFPIGDGMVNIGLGVFTTEYRKHRGPLRAWFDALLRQSPLREQLQGAEAQGRLLSWSLPLAGAKNPLHGEGFVLVGDAAGLVDPFWGHGIDTAMVSGRLASAAVVDALSGRTPVKSALEAYTDAVRGTFEDAWTSHLVLREQLAGLNALLGGTPLEHLQRALGARSSSIEALPAAVR